MKAPAIVVLGSCIIDIMLRTAVLPARGECLVAQAAQTQIGGKASNQAIAMARLGAPPLLITRVGTDAWAELALARWQRAGIDTRCVVRDEQHATGLGVVVVDAAGENVTLTYPGASAALTPADVARAEPLIGAARVFSAHLNAPPATIEAALTLAKDRGLTTILNLSPPEELPEAILRLIDVAVVNRTEAQQLTGCTITTPVAALEAAQRLMARGVGAVIVSLGAQGLALASATIAEVVPALLVAAVDTTGAGDALIAGLAVALAEGRSLTEAARWGAATAALAVTRPGTAEAMPWRTDVERALQTR
ncbi:ribokinase [Kallotenue papyrolyticum]|uniref:ribokinase n=1 Tax=Kallotenue papyrolyticum TaxID=1325125 RepID=UPI0004785F87|nr:ribokinase [Kallotenue papyrolyticum]